jgi:Holliday junction resolvasome RuvABC endonuclease subunit
MAAIRCLGCDPGFASCGVALLELGGDTSEALVYLGVIRTEKSTAKQNILASNDNFRRAREIARELRKLPLPDVVCCESMSFPRNASTAAKMALTWGILADYCEQTGVPLLMSTPKELKRSVCGDASASKEDVQAAMRKRFGTVPADLLRASKIPAGQWEHPFDALASICCCLEHESVRLLRRVSSVR